MVFVRVHLMKERLNTAQKEELGAKLVHAVSEVENLVNNHTHKETSWVQFYEFDPENWYAPANVAGADPNSRIQLDVIAPETAQHTRRRPRHAEQGCRGRAIGVRSRSTASARAVGTHLHHPVRPVGAGRPRSRLGGLPALLRADTPEEADEALALVYWPGRHTAAAWGSPDRNRTSS